MSELEKIDSIILRVLDSAAKATARYRLEFTENKLPASVNTLGHAHWRVRHNETKKWDNIVMFHVLKNGGPPPEPLKKAKLTLIRCSSVEPDWDNLGNSFKNVVDSLVHNAIIIDDKPSVIGRPEVLWERAKPGQGKIKVCVEEINE